MDQSLKQFLSAHPELNDLQINLITQFYEFLLIENQKQNLTRLTSPKDFYESHVLDVLHLLKSEFLIYPAFDLGSGCGVPGLLSALIHNSQQFPWILCDSETKKAQYLQSAVEKFELISQVQVTSQRGEVFLKNHPVGSIVFRAVGPISRIYPLLRKCKTWKTLILFKGPNWPTEWEDFQSGSFKKELQIENEYPYEIGFDKKVRKIIKISRVSK